MSELANPYGNTHTTEEHHQNFVLSAMEWALKGGLIGDPAMDCTKEATDAPAAVPTMCRALYRFEQRPFPAGEALAEELRRRIKAG